MKSFCYLRQIHKSIYPKWIVLSYCVDAVVSSLEEAGVVEQLAALLSSTDNSPEIMSNALVLVDSLCSSEYPWM